MYGKTAKMTRRAVFQKTAMSLWARAMMYLPAGRLLQRRSCTGRWPRGRP